MDPTLGLLSAVTSLITESRDLVARPGAARRDTEAGAPSVCDSVRAMADELHDRLIGPAADEALEWLDLDDSDAEEVREVAAQIASQPDLVRDQQHLIAVLGQAMGIPRPWEVVQLPTRYDPVAGDAPLLDRWWYLVTAMAFVPETLAYHRSTGIPEEVSRRTLADTGRHVRIHRRMWGRTGFDKAGWISIHLRGLLYDLGRLQFNLTTLRLPTDTIQAAGLDRREGDVSLDTHIPETGPLTPAGVDESFGRVVDFFSRHFPEHGPYDHVICSSWLLDRRLTTLVPGTNIDSFCRRWTVIEPGHEVDQSALDFIFRLPEVPLAELPRDSRLQRAVVDHLMAGGHLLQSTGYVSLGR